MRIALERNSSCPVCLGPIFKEQIPLGIQFECPICNQGLRVSPLYDRSVRLLSLISGMGVAWALGLESIFIVGVGPFFGIIALGPLQSIAKSIVPPILEISSGPFQMLNLK